MTGALSSRAKRGLGARYTRKRHRAIAFVYGLLLAILFVCAPSGNEHANSNPVAIDPQAKRAPAAHLASLLAVRKDSAIQRFSSLLRYPPAPAILKMRADVRSSPDITGGVPVFRFARSPSKSPLSAQLSLLASVPATIDARIGDTHTDDVAPVMFVGVASMYDPIHPDEYKDSGGPQTASGELYDEEAWTAAIRIDLRDRFGGVRYGKNYRPTYALVEAGNKSIIVKINDVGPLLPGRIIDLNQRSMHYFDPTLQLGLIKDVRVTPLPGPSWTAGPVGGEDEPVLLAAVAAP